MKKAIVIFSGGQDSTTCLYWALSKFNEVEAITFKYGQKHNVEVLCAERICNIEKVKQTIIDISFLDKVAESALLNNISVETMQSRKLPHTFVPNRNQLFITIAHAYAQKVGANALVTGVCQTDYSGYPDCRQDFINAIEIASNKGSDTEIFIHTPLMQLTKAQTFALAENLGKLPEIINLSHTCYLGDRTREHLWGLGCGKCAACQLRKKGYIEFLELKKIK